MTQSPEFDTVAAHHYFSAHCFNQAWDLMEKAERTAEEDQLMVALNQTSIYHWMNRADCSYEKLSVGYWQASRIQTLMWNSVEAIRLAHVCQRYSLELTPFYLGFAHEAIARAHKQAGHHELAQNHLLKAKQLAERIVDKDDRALLEADLSQIDAIV